MHSEFDDLLLKKKKQLNITFQIHSIWGCSLTCLECLYKKDLFVFLVQNEALGNLSNHWQIKETLVNYVLKVKVNAVL